MSVEAQNKARVHRDELLPNFSDDMHLYIYIYIYTCVHRVGSHFTWFPVGVAVCCGALLQSSVGTQFFRSQESGQGNEGGPGLVFGIRSGGGAGGISVAVVGVAVFASLPPRRRAAPTPISGAAFARRLLHVLRCAASTTLPASAAAARTARTFATAHAAAADCLLRRKTASHSTKLTSASSHTTRAGVAAVVVAAAVVTAAAGALAIAIAAVAARLLWRVVAVLGLQHAAVCGTVLQCVL